MVEEDPGYLYFQKQAKPVSLRGQPIPQMELNLMTSEQTVLIDVAIDGGAILQNSTRHAGELGRC